MKTKRLLIEYPEDLHPTIALSKILVVVAQGQVSENIHGPHYCWHTVFRDGTTVSVNAKRHPDAADSFDIRYENEHQRLGSDS